MIKDILGLKIEGRNFADSIVKRDMLKQHCFMAVMGQVRVRLQKL